MREHTVGEVSEDRPVDGAMTSRVGSGGVLGGRLPMELPDAGEGLLLDLPPHLGGGLLVPAHPGEVPIELVLDLARVVHGVAVADRCQHLPARFLSSGAPGPLGLEPCVLLLEPGEAARCLRSRPKGQSEAEVCP